MTTIQRFAKRLAAGLALVCALAGRAGAATPTWTALINEAASGTTPTQLLDTGPATVLPATITYGTSTGYTTVTAGRGIASVANFCATTGSLASSKVSTGLGGVTQATWEIVADTTNATGFNDMAGVQNTGFDDIATVATGSSGVNQICMSGAWTGTASAYVCFDHTPGLHVFDAVWDTPQASAANRAMLYIDGSLATVDGTPAASVYPTQNSAIDAGFTNYANNRITVGCFIGPGVGAQSFIGPIYYAMLYAGQALSSTVISAHATALLANNDADPNTVASTTFTGDTPWQWQLSDLSVPAPVFVARIDRPVILIIASRRTRALMQSGGLL